MIPFLYEQFQSILEYVQANFNPLIDGLDVIVVAFAFYWLLVLIRGTRAVQMLAGLVLLLLVKLVADFVQLGATGLILDIFLPFAPLIVIVLFQHDIRRALARMGRPLFAAVPQTERTHMLEEVVRATQRLAQNRVGALIVLERETHIEDQLEAGLELDARPSKELLTSIFQPSSPLHDGAVVIENGRISQARCVLPLTQRELPEGLGTRHRAAVGITEETDAVVVVVSEETGRISIVVSGELQTNLDVPDLREQLRFRMRGESPEDVAAPPEGGDAAPGEVTGSSAGTAGART